jgi:hypothetical protein
MNRRTSGRNVAAELHGVHLIDRGDIEFGRAHCILVANGRHTVVVVWDWEELRKGGADECYKERAIITSKHQNCEK